MMNTAVALGRLALLALALAVAGCAPSDQGQLDEEKEPNFLLGRARLNALDYRGAIEAFEKSLEVNPRSSAAHYELGLAYEKHEMNYPAAIYHFEKFLQLRPDSEKAELIRGRIQACKQEIAKSVSLAPFTANMTRELERLTAENRELRQKLQQWESGQMIRSASSGAASATRPTASLAPAGAVPTPSSPAAPPSTAATTASTAPSPPPTSVASPTPAPRPAAPKPTRPAPSIIGTHTVKAGETAATIARRYGVRTDSLQAANPGLDLTKLRPGQAVKIPER